METTIKTHRLELTLLTSAPQGSPEFAWLHSLRSDAKASFWTIGGPSKTLAETEKSVRGVLPQQPSNANEGAKANEQDYRIVYAVHQVPIKTDSNQTDGTKTEELERTFIGLVNLKPANFPLPSHLDAPTSPSNTLSLELAYCFLPAFWGKGYATETLTAVFDALQTAPKVFWGKYEKVWVRALVNQLNGASQKVMQKVGKLTEMGVWVWEGEEAVWVAGEWRVRDEVLIYGGWIVGGKE
ncbi:hypothetical protein BS50DRAFT_568803 [Corynespora cassiicola Philippines]|uniref:N-acetyltransferase domain-containing protein n=1 Tax=Corynespora cassiicola Philippines TaxID=1448308 RepID=A0A2T2P6A5_CORCC|nr:hypothetical protein BS50DRAFT_568803 [Corynespora cassiicola Philippines]